MNKTVLVLAIISVLCISYAIYVYNPDITHIINPPSSDSLDIKAYIYWDSQWTTQDFATYSNGMQLHWNALNMFNIRDYNANYTLFLYRNVRDCHVTDNDRTVPSYANLSEIQYFRNRGWILKDINTGAEVTDPYYGNNPDTYNRYCDIGNSEYQQYIADWYGYYFSLHSYQACFLDNGMCANVGSWHYGSVGNPVNPRTQPQQLWTNQTLIDAYSSMYSKVREKVGSNAIIVANSVGVDTGYKYFHFPDYREPTKTLVNQIDGMMTEHWLWTSDSSSPYFPEEIVNNYNWKDSIDMLKDFEDRFSEKNIILVSDAPERGYSFTETEKQQYCNYVYASMLLGIGSKNTYWLQMGWWGEKNMHNLYDNSNIGTPTGSYIKDTNGLYVREFTNCTVTVNPSTEVRGGMNPHTGKISGKTNTTQYLLLKSMFHIHTTFSDGDYTPEEIVNMYKNAGYDLIALTDHNTIGGFARAKAEGDRVGLTVICGEEISNKWAGSGYDQHIIGLFLTSSISSSSSVTDPKSFFDQIHNQNGIGYVAHPWVLYASSWTTQYDFTQVPWYSFFGQTWIDGWSVNGYTMNGYTSTVNNILSDGYFIEFAHDFHHVSDIPRLSQYWMIIEATTKTEAGIKDALLHQRVVCYDSGNVYGTTEALSIYNNGEV